MARSKFGKKGAKRDYTKAAGRLPKAWSYTRYSVGSKCLLKYALKFIHKLKEPDSYALERGTEVHAQGEGYLKGTIHGVPDAYHVFSDEMKAIKSAGAIAEESWTLTKTWQPTQWDDWDNAWLRAKIDVHLIDGKTLDVIDFKTGRQRDEHEEQTELYALTGFCVYPKVQTIDTEFWYVDSGDVGDFSYKRSQLRGLKAKWRKRIKPILEAKVFPPQPSEEGCKWCPFRSDKKLRNGEAGPCDGWKRV